MRTFASEAVNETFAESPETLADRFLLEKAQAEGITSEDLLARLIDRASRAVRGGECLQPHELAENTLLPDQQKAHVQQCNFCQVLLDGSQPRPEEASQFAETAVAMQRPHRLVNLRWRVEGAAFVYLTGLTFRMVRWLEAMARHLAWLKPGGTAATSNDQVRTPKQMKTKIWEEMTNDEKLDRLTWVLSRAGSDTTFRDRCLSSPESAKVAVSEVGEIEFPPDFEIQFVTPEQRLKKLVLAVPDFIPAENGTPADAVFKAFPQRA